MRFVVPCCVAPKAASDPHVPDAKPMGRLGFESSNSPFTLPLNRWNRLISPQGVSQVPKARASFMTTRSSASSFSCAGVSAAM